MWGWSFESAFANTELNADYWIIKAGGRSIRALQAATFRGDPAGHRAVGTLNVPM
jgi:hypothetical protein